MQSQFITVREAASRLGISSATLYDWLARSEWGQFIVRGEAFTISYFQGGARGQGRIQIEASEVDRLREAMRVTPKVIRARITPAKRTTYPGITVKLGLPTDR